MNKPLFWTGIGFQFIHLSIFIIGGLVILFGMIDWSLNLLMVIGYICFNIITLSMIVLGLILPNGRSESSKWE